MASLFISYSRKDIDSARKLTEAFKGQDLDFWIDWEGIPPTVDWWKEIEKGIEEADIFLFLLSPHSCKSSVCQREIEHAAKNGKRLVPVVVRDVRAEESPAELRHLNWIFIREQDEFNAGFGKLITAVKTDYEWVQAHRQVQIKALEWERSSHENSFLLRGKELQDAEQQLVAHASKEPHPTDLQREYLLKSRQASDRQRRFTTSIAIAVAIVLAVLAIFGFVQAGLATENAAKEQAASTLAFSNANTAEAASTLAFNNAGTAQANAEEALRQLKIARARELVTQSVTARDRDFLLSLLLGIEAYRSADHYQTRNLLLSNIQSKPQLVRYLSEDMAGISDVAFSPDGAILAVAGCGKVNSEGSCEKGEARLFDVTSGQQIINRIVDSGGRLSFVAFSPDRRILAVRSSEAIFLYEAEGMEPISEPLRARWAGGSFAFSPNGKFLAAEVCREFNADEICLLNEIVLWEVASGRLLDQRFSGHESAVTSIAFSPDGRYAASSSWDFSVRVWEVATGKEIHRLEHEYQVFAVAFSPDGEWLATGDCAEVNWAFCRRGRINLWDAVSGQPKGQPLIGHETIITRLAFSMAGSLLASLDSDGTIILWEIGEQISNGEVLTDDPIGDTASGAFALAFSPDSKTLASVTQIAGVSSRVALWNLEGGNFLSDVLTNSAPYLSRMAFSPDGTILAVGDDQNSVVLWDVESRQVLGEPLRGHDDLVYSLAFSPNGKILASGSYDHTLILWDVEKRQSVGEPLQGHNDRVSSVAFSPDGNLLASSSYDGTIILWDTMRQPPPGEPLRGHTDAVNQVAFRADGKILASGSDDGTVILWDVKTRQPIGEPLRGHTREVMDIAFSPDGTTLASGDVIGTILLWDAISGQNIGNIEGWSALRLDALAFGPDEGILAFSGCKVETGNALCVPVINMWDIANRQLAGQLLVQDTTNLIAFSPDGLTLASSGFRGTIDSSTIILWDLNPESWIQKTCQRVGRNFTRQEWSQYIPNEEYRKTCDQWPLELEIEPTLVTVP